MDEKLTARCIYLAHEHLERYIHSDECWLSLTSDSKGMAKSFSIFLQYLHKFHDPCKLVPQTFTQNN